MSIKQGEPGYDLLFSSTSRLKPEDYGKEITDEILEKIKKVKLPIPVDKEVVKILAQCPNLKRIDFVQREVLEKERRQNITEGDIDDLIESMNVATKYCDPESVHVIMDQKDKPMSKETYEKLGKAFQKLRIEEYEVGVFWQDESKNHVGMFFIEGHLDNSDYSVNVNRDNYSNLKMPPGTIDNVVFLGKTRSLGISQCPIIITEIPKEMESLSCQLCEVDVSNMSSSNLKSFDITVSTDLKTGKDIAISDILANKNISLIPGVSEANRYWDSDECHIKFRSTADFSKMEIVSPYVKRISIVCDEETDFAQIAKIFPNLESIELSAARPSVVSLKGIENLKNLQSFVCSEKECLLKDFEHLSQIETLTEINLSNQQLLHKFDVSKLTNLKKLNFSHSTVDEIEGLDQIEPTTNTLFNFAKCFSLKEVKGLDEFLQKAAQNPKIMDYVIKVDDVFYQKHMSETVNGEKIHEQAERALLEEWQTKQNRSCISIDTEFSNNSHARDRGNPVQMKAQRKYIDYILTKECGITPKDDDWTRAKKAYDWLTQNVHYADGMLNFKKDKPDYDPRFFGKEGYDHYFLASPYFALLKRHDIKPLAQLDNPTEQDQLRGWGPEKERLVSRNIQQDTNGIITSIEEVFDPVEKEHYSVCEGIANLYVQMLQHMGIEAYESAFGWDGYSSGHAITRAKIDGEFYYFDPTWDLGKNEYEHFGVTKEQAEQRHKMTRNDELLNAIPPNTKDVLPKWYYDEDYLAKSSRDRQADLKSRGLLTRAESKQEEMDAFNQAMLTKKMDEKKTKFPGLFKKIKRIAQKRAIVSEDVMNMINRSAFERSEDMVQKVGLFGAMVKPDIKKLKKNRHIKYHQVENEYVDEQKNKMQKKKQLADLNKQVAEEEKEQKEQKQEKVTETKVDKNEQTKSKIAKIVTEEEEKKNNATTKKPSHKEQDTSFGL